jgi:hypothetical protein
MPFEGIADQIDLGAAGADRIADTNPHTPSDAPHDVWLAVEAVSGSPTFGAGCEVAAGDPPQAGDPVPQSGKLRPFTQVQIEQGVVEAVRG